MSTRTTRWLRIRLIQHGGTDCGSAENRVHTAQVLIHGETLYGNDRYHWILDEEPMFNKPDVGSQLEVSVAS